MKTRGESSIGPGSSVGAGAAAGGATAVGGVATGAHPKY